MKTGNKQTTNSLIPVVSFQRDFLGGSVIKNPLADAGDMGSIPGSGRSPGEGNGSSLQYSCLQNPMDRGAWRATVRVERLPDRQALGKVLRVLP